MRIITSTWKHQASSVKALRACAVKHVILW